LGRRLVQRTTLYGRVDPTTLLLSTIRSRSADIPVSPSSGVAG